MNYLEMNAVEFGGFTAPSVASDIGSILRGEIAATEAYRQVIDKLNESPDAWKLEKFMHDHEDAVNYWRSQMKHDLSQEKRSSGIWGKAMKAFIATAKLMGNNTAIAALKEGELYGKNIYQDLLNSSSVSPAQKSYIRTVLLPAHESHIQRLNGMTAQA